MEIPDLEIRKEWKSSHFYIRLYTILHIFPINNFSQFLKKCYCLRIWENRTKKSCCGGFSAYGRLPPHHPFLVGFPADKVIIKRASAKQHHIIVKNITCNPSYNPSLIIILFHNKCLSILTSSF